MEKTSPTTTYCYGNKVAIVIWIKERLLAVMIEDKIIAKSFKEFFEMSETATRNLLASAESKRVVSEHAQEHAPPFRAAVLDILWKNAKPV